MTIRLQEVTRETLRAICKLDAGEGATQVAPNALSIAEASFHAEAWFRAIYDDETPVGFVMLYDPTLSEQPEEPHFFLWRLMIDRAHQSKGFGHAAVKLLIDAGSGAIIDAGHPIDAPHHHHSRFRALSGNRLRLR